MLEDNNKKVVYEMKLKIIRIAIIVFIIIVAISSYLLIKEFFQSKKNNDINIKLSTDVIIEDEDTENVKIDWKQLEDINNNIIGWIKIKNTNINYPILQDDDSLKYLKRSFNMEYNKNGSIFTLNSKPFQEDVTIIYGHNMRNGSMFSNLSKYMNKKFFYEHSTFEIYTKNHNYKATIFSCYSIGISEEERNIKLLNFPEEIEYYKKQSKYYVDIGEIEKIVKLSTCSYINSHTRPTDQRYYIVAKLEEV